MSLFKADRNCVAQFEKDCVYEVAGEKRVCRLACWIWCHKASAKKEESGSA